MGTTVKGKSLPKPQATPRRTAIVAAAIAVLMERGYAGASTLEIARRAKVSKRELYAEFGSKSGILEALIEATSAETRAPLTTAQVVDRDSLADALIAYGSSALTELTSPPVVAITRLAAAEAGRSADLGKILDQRGREPNRRALIDLVAKAQAADVLRAGDAEMMAGQFFALLMGDVQMRLVLGVAKRPSSREIRQRAERAAQAVLVLHCT